MSPASPEKPGANTGNKSGKKTGLGAGFGANAGPDTTAPGGPLSWTEIYRGRKIFILGATGFVGKVALAMLLDRFPDVGRVYVMVRRGTGTDSESRFWNSVVRSPAFNSLRDKYGGDEGMADFIRQKVEVVDGDITAPNVGLSDEDAERIAKDIDVVLNSSGRVTFNPPLESALRTNVEGTKNVIAFVKRMRRPALVHTSTCFVAGNRQGEVWENEELNGYFPNRGEMAETEFSIEREVADSERVSAEVRAQAGDAQIQSELMELARKRLRDTNRNPDDKSALKLTFARERKDWVRNELTQRGMDRAAYWGWPNIYTYTKSMGDQLVAREKDIVRAIVRPAIVESSESFPFPGWNEGFTTSAPLVYLALKGQNLLPAGKDVVLDVVPVDHIAAGMLMVAAQCCVEQPKMVYQLSSGDLNPVKIARVVTLTGLYKRKTFQNKDEGNKFLNELVARMEYRPVSYEEYDRVSLPLVSRIADGVSKGVDKLKPKWGGGRLAEVLGRLDKNVKEAARVANEANENVVLFKPFVYDNAYIYRADNIRALRIGRRRKSKTCSRGVPKSWTGTTGS